MHKKAFWTVALAILAVAVVVHIPGAETVYSQGGRPQVTPEQLEKRRAIENELQSIAIVERKLMIPMRDGVKIATDVYRPKDTSKKYATIFVRTPYNFNYWDIRNSAPRDLSNELEAVKRGYAFVEMNERGRFFSEGNYDILGPPLTDGVDEFNWIAKQPWSNGKVGTIGCSSTAEWQLAVAAQSNPAYTTMIRAGLRRRRRACSPLRTGKLVSRRRGPNAVYRVALRTAEPGRPMFAPNTSQEDLIRASKAFDLAPQLPTVDWSKALRHLPVQDILAAVDAPHGIFADRMPVDTGGAMIQREPNDPAWYKGGLARQHARQHSRILVHVVVRRVDWSKPRCLQSCA